MRAQAARRGCVGRALTDQASVSPPIGYRGCRKIFQATKDAETLAGLRLEYSIILRALRVVRGEFFFPYANTYCSTFCNSLAPRTSLSRSGMMARTPPEKS